MSFFLLHLYNRLGDPPGEEADMPIIDILGFRRSRRALLHVLRRRLHLKGHLVQGERLHQPLRPEVDGLAAAHQRPLPGAQRPAHGPDEQVDARNDGRAWIGGRVNPRKF